MKEVKELRNRLGYTQKSFAFKIKTSLRAVGNYENGRRPEVSVLASLGLLADRSQNYDLAATFSFALMEDLGITRDELLVIVGEDSS